MEAMLAIRTLRMAVNLPAVESCLLRKPADAAGRGQTTSDLLGKFARGG